MAGILRTLCGFAINDRHFRGNSGCSVAFGGNMNNCWPTKMPGHIIVGKFVLRAHRFGETQFHMFNNTLDFPPVMGDQTQGLFMINQMRACFFIIGFGYVWTWSHGGEWKDCKKVSAVSSVCVYIYVFVSVHACVSSPIAHMGWSSPVYQIQCVSEQIGNANFTLRCFVSYRSLTLIPPLSSCLNE